MDRYATSFIKPECPKFIAGNLSITSNAKSQMSHEDILIALKRHMLGDWGELDNEDKAANEAALKEGGRLVSRYTSASGVPFYVITEADRSLTTFLLPEDY